MKTTGAAREQELVTAFVRLADTLGADYDVIDLFHGLCGDCVTLLGADAAGLVLTDQRGALQVVSASSEAATLVELFQLESEEGPCLDCFDSSTQVHASDLASDGRWPQFAGRAAEHGFVAVHALPMRLRGQTIGALDLFHRRSVTMAHGDLAVGQALADVATIAILSDRNTRERERLTEQLQAALTSRVIIEQAKGILAERGQIALDEAFTRLRSHARADQWRLSDLARAVIDGSFDTAPLLR